MQVAGISPETFRSWTPPRTLRRPGGGPSDPPLPFPGRLRRLAPGDFHLVLAGHLHGGQICLPFPGGKLRLEHLRAVHWEGLHETPVGVVHVSRGLGTSFVPFRLSRGPAGGDDSDASRRKNDEVPYRLTR